MKYVCCKIVPKGKLLEGFLELELLPFWNFRSGPTRLGGLLGGGIVTLCGSEISSEKSVRRKSSHRFLRKRLQKELKDMSKKECEF